MQYKVKSMAFVVKWPGFKSWFYQLLVLCKSLSLSASLSTSAGWLWQSDNPTSQGCSKGEVRWAIKIPKHREVNSSAADSINKITGALTVTLTQEMSTRWQLFQLMSKRCIAWATWIFSPGSGQSRPVGELWFQLCIIEKGFRNQCKVML